MEKVKLYKYTGSFLWDSLVIQHLLDIRPNAENHNQLPKPSKTVPSNNDYRSFLDYPNFRMAMYFPPPTLWGKRKK